MSLRRVLSLPGWGEHVRVLAGSSGLDRPLRTVQATLDASHLPAPGELTVVARPVAGTDWQIDALLRRCADAGATAVLLSGTEPLSASRLLADRLAVPLLVTSAAPLDLLVEARLLLTAPELDRAELLLATHRALGDRLRPPEEVVAVLRRLLRSGVAVLDDRGVPLAGEVGGRVRLDEAVPQRTELDDGVLLAHPVLLQRPALWLAAELRGTEAARADVVPPALAVAAGALQRWLLANRLELERDARSRTALLGDLLRLDTEPGADLRRRVADAGWRLGGWHVGLHLGVPAAVDTVARTQEVMRALDVEAVVEHGDGWTGWVTFDHEPTAERVRALATRLQAAHRTLHLGAHMGVGRPHPRPEGLATTVAEALDAARLAATRPETGHFLHVDQLGMAQLLLEWTRTDTFEPAARALVAPLRDAPGDLVRTLAAYLDAESSIAETATVLGVHRNTVAARIARIEQLLGVDLSRPDERLALHLASRAVILAGE
ncbi:PucR C-terminal helix-turn-helix domain-containing protein [Amycolatopsis pretoriensis]|uniref:PucR C-terminal helix-turn-helix domain-containing protein n=1 Tax=Amycolatopsis pretoriensis TaxID=218821 RepID=A0A1H5QFU4_9PSEU|nr:PucR family transcriptional regulator [Amycolatopsis pretoriensis]SEF25013.1 PucR C-terminal helix-turn-helix domain-containing protein [Amycolatopsis pretoriensis]